jgi:RNA polymerase sigma-70 factor, ECF subfamily
LDYNVFIFNGRKNIWKIVLSMNEANPQEAADLQPGEDRDALLMVQATTGDLAAFEELVIRNQSAAWVLAFHYLGDRAESEDIVQEAFLRLLRAAPRYTPTAKFRTYFNRIVVRLCLDFRSKKRPVYCETIPKNAGEGNNPEQLFYKQETASKLKRAIAELAPTQRMAFLLRHLEGFTYSEIAEAMNLTPKAVDSLLQRGRQALRANLQSRSK